MLLSVSNSNEKVETSAMHYISIPLQLYTDLCEYVAHYDTEVSGCGMVERVEHRFPAEDKDEPDLVEIEFAVRELYLPHKQDNTGSTTEIDEATIAELMTTLLKEGKNTEHLRLHWHSHADMDTFHSGTDEDNYKTLSNGDFLVSLVANKANKILGRVDYFKPLRITMSGIAVYLDTPNECKPSKAAVESIKKLDKYVKENVRTIGSYYSRDLYGYGGYDDLSGYSNSTITTKKDNVSYTKQDENVPLSITDMEVARKLKVSFKDAQRYINCREYRCDSCPDVSDCINFQTAVAEEIG